jgi:hypothetical protein
MLVVTRRLVTLSAAALLTAVTLAACTQPGPGPTQSPVPTAKHTPAFASDAEALKAATDAYAAYLKMSDTIAHDGGANPERIKPYASGDALDAALQSAQQFRAAGAHSIGSTTVAQIQPQVVDYQNVRNINISFYACEDVSEVDVLDQDGISLVSQDRPSRATYTVTVLSRSGRLAVDSDEPWTGASICA